MFEWFNVGISFASPKFEYSYSPVASKIEFRIFCFVYKSLILFKFKWVILIKKKNSGVCFFLFIKIFTNTMKQFILSWVILHFICKKKPWHWHVITKN